MTLGEVNSQNDWVGTWSRKKDYTSGADSVFQNQRIRRSDTMEWSIFLLHFVKQVYIVAMTVKAASSTIFYSPAIWDIGGFLNQDSSDGDEATQRCLVEVNVDT